MQNIFTMIANVSGIRWLTEVWQKTSHGMLLNSVMKDCIDTFLVNKKRRIANTSKGIRNGYPYFCANKYDKSEGRRLIWAKRETMNVTTKDW